MSKRMWPSWSLSIAVCCVGLDANSALAPNVVDPPTYPQCQDPRLYECLG